MNKKVYFAGSIRGGRVDANLYKQIIAYIQKTDNVLTEHIGYSKINTTEQGFSKDGMIYQQDTAWIQECDVLIAECTCPSLGVGYELAYAEQLGKPCYLFYNKNECHLSAMLTGNSYFHIIPYYNSDDIFTTIDRILK